MAAFHDFTTDTDEPSEARMNFRTKARIKKTIQKAAALAGVDDSTFTMSAAYQSALATIAAHERTTLGAIDHAAFFAAIDSSAEPTTKLKDAFAHHRDTVRSK